MKQRIISLCKKYRELLLYLVVGFSATAINFVLYVMFNAVLGDALYQVSNVIAWLVSTTFGFFMYKLIVFRSMSMHITRLLVEGTEFYLARIFSLILETVGLYLLIDVLDFSRFGCHLIILITGETIAKFIMLVITTISNYIFSKFIVFKAKKGD
ncbi:MAG: GtrA family protein [Clostridia bacterium]|nr:GtrA family protein [Clostridia bacterium]